MRFIRYHAKDYKVDPERFAIIGASAGGHLSLMQGTAGDGGNPKAEDPVDRVSSRVQVVAAFFPPTDFLNWGKKGNELIDRQLQPPFTAAVDYLEFDQKKALYQRITDPKRLREIARQISPITHLTATSAPALIIHGDKDTLVPIQQAEVFVERCGELKVPVKLEVRKGEGHGWKTIGDDMGLIVDWFDTHLRKGEKKGSEGS